MPLNIGVGRKSLNSCRPLWDEPGFCFLDDEGYYWFLHPLFWELAEKTGQYIDLYGDAAFSGESLRELERVLVQARAQVLAQPESWKVKIGTLLDPVHKKQLYARVTREEFLKLLREWRRVIRRARARGRRVVCFGD
ncbi:MAG: hypothetical protein L0215_09045 [Gemmataceae bacterium]|nr:hypothetical protein [Gemmataceae bacterium]